MPRIHNRLEESAHTQTTNVGKEQTRGVITSYNNTQARAAGMGRAHRGSPVKSPKHIGAHNPHGPRHNVERTLPQRPEQHQRLPRRTLMPEHALDVMALSASDHVERTGARHSRKESGAELRQAGLVGQHEARLQRVCEGDLPVEAAQFDASDAT